MQDILQNDMEEFIDNSRYQDPAGIFDKIPETQWGSIGPHSKHKANRRDSAQTRHDSMLSPPEADDISSSGVSSGSLDNQFGQDGFLDSSLRSCESDSPTEVILVARKAQNALYDADTAKMARSERARKAANQRHSMPKASERKHDSSGKVTKSTDLREATREKNRVAAAKCRRKKKENETSLETIYRNATAAHTSMKLAVRELRDELTFWRTVALDHMDGNNGCKCDDIQQYNKNQAHMTALNVQCQSAFNQSTQAQQEEYFQSGLLTRSSPAAESAADNVSEITFAGQIHELADSGHHNLNT